MTDNTLRLGTRGSALALWQAHTVARLLQPQATSIEIIKSQGDQFPLMDLRTAPGKGFFTKELEEALLEKRIDLAVHSLKDLPTEDPEGLKIGAILERGLPEDALILPRETPLANTPTGLPLNALVGTGSLRRQSQLLSLQPELKCIPIRGNVPTRCRKVLNGELDALVLAAAGITRLDLLNEEEFQSLQIQSFSMDKFVPAPGQGAMAVQIRSSDEKTYNVISKLNHAATALAVSCERNLLSLFGGGCQLPLGAFARVEHGVLILRARVIAPDGSESFQTLQSGKGALEVATLAHKDLVQQGAEQYL